jgi:hypothetical protein
LSVFHVAYGLTLQADVPLPGLLIQSKTHPVDVRIHLQDESVFPSAIPNSPDELLYASSIGDNLGPPNLRAARLAGGKYTGFFYGDGARFAVHREGNEVWADWPEGYTIEDACTYLIGPVLAFALRLRGGTCLHASAIAIGNQAIALVGAPGAGKSTTAAAFARLGYPVLSDDVAVLVDLGDRFLVQPGYPRVNLWPDSVRTLFGSEDALPCITPTWEKRYLTLGQDGYRFQSSPLPVGAIYFLDERETELNAPAIEEVVGPEALINLVVNTYVNYLLDRDMRAREFDTLRRLLTSVHLRRVRPTAEPSQVFALCDCIIADARRLSTSDSTILTPEAN